MLDSQFSLAHPADGNISGGGGGDGGGGQFGRSGITVNSPIGSIRPSVPEHKWVPPEPIVIYGKAKKIQIKDNMTTVDRVILCASETVGTAILVFMGCMACIGEPEIIGPTPATLLQITLAFGLAVMISIQAVGHISGSHINPIVTIGAAVLGHLPLILVPIYFVGQMLGALIGFSLVKLANPSDAIKASNVSLGVCSPGLNPSITPIQGFLVEFLISFILVLTCAGFWDVRNSTRHDSIALKLGLTISALAIIGAPYTGANMNPARSFAPALLNGDWEYHWIYWIAPILGSIVASGLYRYIFSNEAPNIESKSHEVIPLNDTNKA